MCQRSLLGRSLSALGHEVKLLPPQHVKPYIRGQKNDYNDATGIAEAVTRPGMPSVEIKTIEQQDIQALHRLRNSRVKERIALCNQLRRLLGEHGIIIPRGVGSLRKQVPDILACADNGPIVSRYSLELNRPWFNSTPFMRHPISLGRPRHLASASALK